MGNKKSSKPKVKRKDVLTFFLVMIPSLVIALTSAIQDSIIRFGIQVVLLIWQAVIMWSMLQDFYSYPR